MDRGVVHIDLPEAREPLSDFLVPQDTDAERRLTFDILVECDLGTGKQADRKIWLSDRRKTTGNRVVEFRRHQLMTLPPASAPNAKPAIATAITIRGPTENIE